MDTRSIVVIKTILEEGSFQKAAQRLNCSQSTVTFQVRQLENELSVRLFERLGRRMVFTPAGKSILPHMEAILHAMQAITACNDPASLHGELRVAVAESLLSYKLHALLGDFVERAPAVKLQLHSLNCHDIREGILSGQYDLGVYYDVGGHPHTLEVLPLGQAKGIIVASPLLAPGLRDFDTPHQRKETSFIINEPRSIYRERMEAHLRARDILFRNTIELWSLESIKKTVAANLGVSFLPTFAVEQELATGSLIELPVRMSGCIVQAICVWHKNRESTPAMRLFRDLLQASALFPM
ncbi:LysR family transcriptional regulator [Desulfovibrio piger]|uniref:LysR family transcriptional regulator n=1 Tax=Desulfovibrio piger TaxID=901 RepID=UPI00195EF503|nr:LysR family transcriptional regulator [uncultured Desulfovibrio sp.]MBM6835612.1 LysR family transcriptional regulator [Desulfovibrio piger]